MRRILTEARPVVTRAAAYFLFRLRDHLKRHGPGVRANLLTVHKRDTGKRLRSTVLSRWLMLRAAPSFDSALVLLRFALHRGIIKQGTNRTLFIYRAMQTEEKPAGWLKPNRVRPKAGVRYLRQLARGRAGRAVPHDGVGRAAR